MTFVVEVRIPLKSIFFFFLDFFFHFLVLLTIDLTFFLIFFSDCFFLLIEKHHSTRDTMVYSCENTCKKPKMFHTAFESFENLD